MQAKLMQHTPTAPREGRATPTLVVTAPQRDLDAPEQSYRTELVDGGHVEIVITPGYPDVVILCDRFGRCSSVDLTEAEAYDVAHHLARRA